MRGLALNFASTHQTENPQGFSEVGENKQLLIAIVVKRIYSVLYLLIISFNFGLHDLAFPDNEHISVSTYKQFLKEIAKTLLDKAPRAQQIRAGQCLRGHAIDPGATGSPRR